MLKFKSKCQYANSTKTSMKTTVPKGMVDMFRLNPGDQIIYEVDFIDGEWVVRLKFNKKTE